MQKQHIVEDVQRLLHLYKERNVLVSSLAARPEGLKRRLWRLSLGMELVASPSLLVLDGLCEGGFSAFEYKCCADTALMCWALLQRWSSVDCPGCMRRMLSYRVSNCVPVHIAGMAANGAQLSDALQLLCGLGMTIVSNTLPG